jgi:hypothetical protein
MAMDLQEMEAAILELIEEAEGSPGDAHEIYLRVRQILDQLRAMDMPPPEDLVRLERELEESFARDKAASTKKR